MFMLHIRPRFQDRVLRVSKKLGAAVPCTVRPVYLQYIWLTFVYDISPIPLACNPAAQSFCSTQRIPIPHHPGQWYSPPSAALSVYLLYDRPCPTVHLYIQTYLQYINQLPQHTLPWPFVNNNRTVYTRLSMYLSLLREVAKVKIFTGKTTANRGKSNIL